MKKIILIILFFASKIVFAKNSALTNKVSWEWFNLSLNFKFSNTFATNTDFYKFIIVSPGFDLNNPYPMPGDVIYIPFTILNVGSINETNGIKLSSFFNTNIGKITLISNTNSISQFTNISSLTSGEYKYYFAKIIIYSNISDGYYNFYVTNTSISSEHPLKVIYSNRIGIFRQSVQILWASDGVHKIYNFDGTEKLGNLDIEICLSFYRLPGDAYLYYDIGSDPDGSEPDGSLNKNRKVQIIKKGEYYYAKISSTDPEIKEGALLRFIIIVDGRKFYYAGNIPYSFYIKEYREQPEEGEEPVIVLDNVGDFRKNPVKIVYTLYRSSFVNITVFNLRGEVIKILKNSTLPAGKYTEVWDGKNEYGNETSAGLYFIYVNTSEYGATRKILFVKEK